MCRNIKTLFNFEPPATELEIRDAALQFVRKLSGFTVPSKANEAAFEQAVAQVADAARGLIAWSSPIGRAVRGAAVGDLRRVMLPSGERELEIVAISYPPSSA